MKKEYITVGKIRDAHGLKGELYAIFFSGEWAWADGLKEVHLSYKTDTGKGKHEQKGELYAIKSLKPHKKGLIVNLQDIKSRTEAEFLRGAEFQIPTELASSKPEEDIYLLEVQGFEVTDKTLGSLGTVEEFSSNGAQDLIVVRGTKDCEVPFIKEFILNIDWDNKKIEMDLPEGLVE